MSFSEKFKWHLRHIVIDHKHKRILLQVMWDNNGYINLDEFRQIKAGNFMQFLPTDLSHISIEVRQEIKALLASNYVVEPVFFQGIQNEAKEFAVLQLTPIEDPTLIKLATN